MTEPAGQNPSATDNDFEKFIIDTGCVFFATPQEDPKYQNNKVEWHQGLCRFAQNDSPPTVIGSAIFFLQKLQEPGLFSGLPVSPELCSKISKDKNEIVAYHQQCILRLCEELLVKGREAKEHRERRQAFDQAIKFLLVLKKGTSSDTPSPNGHIHFQDQVSILLAEAYYLRGKIIRPKGFSVPAKKIETLEVAEKILVDLVARDTTGKARRLRAMVHIDLAALRDPADDSGNLQDYRQALEQAVSSIGDTKTCGRDEIVIILARAEDNAGWTGSDGLSARLEELVNNGAAGPLDQARAYLLLGQNNLAVTQTEKAITRMAATDNPTPFSHEDWRLLVRLLRDLKHQNTAGIDKLILDTWRKVHQIERQTKNGMHVRWYWSRQRDLYDLAFHAAGNDARLKAQIADSLKARPALHLGQAADLGLAVEQMEAGLLDRYMPGKMLEQTTDMAAPAAPGSAGWPELPRPWIAVHFYLSNGFGHPEGKQQGHALIQDSSKGDGKDTWSERTFDYFPIWAAFMTWQENYQRLKKEAAPDLERLCQVMGRQMPFLFAPEDLPLERPVVFVPHDFLHRLPLHAALIDNGEESGIPAQSHPITYLPGWWMVTSQAANPNETASKNTPSPVAPVALVHWDNSEDIHDIIKQANGTVVVNASRSDWLKLKHNAVGLKVLYCHGQAGYTNPFASSLKLDGGGLYLKDVVKGPPLVGRFILAACESDLVLPASTTLDEYFSFSTGLLQKGAAEILGTLWEVNETDALSLIETVLRAPASGNLSFVLRDWLRDNLRSLTTELFYDIAAFRALGGPYPVDTKEEHR